MKRRRKDFEYQERIYLDPPGTRNDSMNIDMADKKSDGSGKKNTILIGIFLICVILCAGCLFYVCASLFYAGVMGTTQIESGTVMFGSYEQDNDPGNGKEPIEWMVLDRNKETGQSLLLSKYILDVKPYNVQSEDVTWESCTLRKWLNEGFFDAAFSDEEKSKIAAAHLQNPDTYVGFNDQGKETGNNSGEGITDLKYQVSGGNDTEDRVFLLNIDEVKRWLGDEHYEGENGLIVYPNVQASGTEYANTQGLIKNTINNEEEETVRCWWWTRSSGGYDEFSSSAVSDKSIFVNSDGYFFDMDVEWELCGVRPAMWVNLES